MLSAGDHRRWPTRLSSVIRLPAYQSHIGFRGYPVQASLGDGWPILREEPLTYTSHVYTSNKKSDDFSDPEAGAKARLKRVLEAEREEKKNAKQALRRK